MRISIPSLNIIQMCIMAILFKLTILYCKSNPRTSLQQILQKKPLIILNQMIQQVPEGKGAKNT